MVTGGSGAKRSANRRGLIGPVRLMVEEHHPSRLGRAGRARPRTRRWNGRKDGCRRFIRRDLGVVDERIAPFASSRAGKWYSPQPSGPGPMTTRAVVGHVGEDRGPVAHAISVGASPFVRDLPCLEAEAFGLERSRR